MVKKYLLSLMLFALITPWAAFGQNHTLTVYDGEVTKKSVPMYVYYFDDFSRSQYVIPATQIDAMTTGTISAIKYYTSFTQEYTTLSEVDIYLAEVSSTSISDFIDKSNATIVYSGTVDFVLVDEKCEATITFTTPYTYNGGNLLIGCDNTTDAGFKNISFYGQSVSGASVAGYNSNSLSGVTAYQQDFIPKTTFTFTGGNSNYCEAPSNLQISNVTHESATVSWTSAVGNYNLEYKRSTDDEYTRVGVSTNSYTFTGLTSLTNYDVRVQAVCDPGVTESLWMEGSFTTTTVAEEVGNAWSDDFEGNACGWELINGTCTNAWVWGTAANYDGSYGLYISNDEGTTNAYTVNSSTMVYATKLLNFTEGKFEFSYNWMANGESTYDYLRVALVPSSVALTAGTNVPSGFGTSILPADWIALDGGSKLNQVSEWQSQNVAINVTAGNYYLVLAWRNDSSQGNQPPAAVDNVSITKIACEYEVTDLAVSGITTTSASLSWDGGEAAQWQVAYGTSNNFEGATVEIVDEATYDMIGLEDNTTFYVRIRAYCGGNDFGAWTSTQFKTACAASTEYPFTENFDSYTGVTSGSINNLPDCWNYINGTTYSYYAGYPVVYNASNYSNSGNNHLRLYSYANYNEDNTTTYDPKDQYAILPPMENLNGKQLTLFARGANTNSTFKVGMMTDPTDASTFVEIATTAPTGNYEEYTYQLTGTGNYLAIMIEAATSTATSRTVYIDDITIDFPPTCPKPTSLTYADVTGHGATLSWTENGEAEAWQVCLNDDEENLIDVTENPYTLTELAEETDFTVKVRANCGGNNGVSEWSNVVSFTTPQACPVPTSLFISDITGYHATLDWNGSTDSYNVMYRTKATADGLLEDFSTALNWEKYTGLLEYVLSDSIDLTTTTSGWVYGTGNGVFDRHAKINIWSTNIKNWLVTPSVEVAENYMFSFDLALTKFSGSLQPVVDTLQQDDKFVVLITTDDGSNWTILRQWDNTESEYVFNNIACSATGEHVSFDLSEYLGQNVRIAFYAESTESGGDNNLHIDNVLIGIPIPAGEWQIYASDTTSYTITGLNPETDYEVRVESSCPDEISHATSIVSFTTDMACLAPTGLAATQIMPNSIELTWTDRNEATAWQIQVNEEDPMDVTAIPYLVENLESDSTYTFMVRSNCGVEGYSEWSNAINVTTLVACPVPTDVEMSDITHNGATMTWTGYNESYTVMIAEGNTVLNADFETGDLSQGDFTTTADYAWTVVLDTITETLYAMSYSGGHSQTSALELEVTLTEESTLTFSAKISSESGWDKGYFSIDSVYHINGISGNGDWIHYSYPLPAGTHTLGWYYIKDSSVSNFKDCFYVDDIVIISFPAGDEYNTTAQTYTFEDLTASTPYMVKVKGVCDETETEWSEIATFTTLTAPIVGCLVPQNVVVDDITANSVTAHNATITWTENGEANAWIVEYATDADFFEVLSETVEDTPTFTFQDLAPETTYYVRVKAQCGPGDESEYSEVVNFTTTIACPAPTNLTANPGNYSAVLNWNGTNDNYIVNYRRAAYKVCSVPYKAGEWQTVTVDETTATLTDLTPETDYEARVLSDCGELDSLSVWTSVITFTTLENCPVPQNVEVDDITYNSATVSWEGYSDNYNVSYRTAAYKVCGVPYKASAWETVTVDETTATITGLTPETDYEVKVQGICDETETEWSEIATFTTSEQTTLTQTVELTAGMNWVSFFVETNLNDLRVALVEALGTSATIIVKSRVASTKYQRGRWSGQLAELNMAEMYVIDVPNDCEISLVGMPINPAEHSVTIEPGENWIAFPFSQSMSHSNAFDGFAVNNDQLQSQTQNTKYQRDRWAGQLNTLEPGQGYKYIAPDGNTRTFTFPTSK